MTKRNHTKNGGGGTGNGKTQTFSFTAHEATSVQLVGDFTRWQQAPVSLRKGADGLWQAAVAMPPGEHHYRFIVDGQWQDDPQCAQYVPNPYGGQNAVRQVA